MPCSGPRPSRGSSTHLDVRRQGRQRLAGGAHDDDRVRGRPARSTPQVRRSRVEPCHSRDALGAPIRDERPPASTTPAALTRRSYVGPLAWPRCAGKSGRQSCPRPRKAAVTPTPRHVARAVQPRVAVRDAPDRRHPAAGDGRRGAAARRDRGRAGVGELRRLLVVRRAERHRRRPGRAAPRPDARRSGRPTGCSRSSSSWPASSSSARWWPATCATRAGPRCRWPRRSAGWSRRRWSTSRSTSVAAPAPCAAGRCRPRPTSRSRWRCSRSSAATCRRRCGPSC